MRFGSRPRANSDRVLAVGQQTSVGLFLVCQPRAVAVVVFISGRATGGRLHIATGTTQRHVVGDAAGPGAGSERFAAPAGRLDWPGRVERAAEVATRRSGSGRHYFI